jgi:hypothetical protein
MLKNSILAFLFLLPLVSLTQAKSQRKQLQTLGKALARETNPAAIEKVYRQAEPYKSMVFQRVDKLPFVFFIEDQGRGNLEFLAKLRFHALMAIKGLFEKDFAKPLKLKMRKRPMPFWILKSRNSYLKAGGGKFSAAHFNLMLLHTMTYYDRKEGVRRSFEVAMHESVHQIMFAFTNPENEWVRNRMSAWLMEGMAEHLSSRPHEPLILTKDPGFGWIDKDRLKDVRPYLRKPFKWKHKSRLPWLHHPLYVMTFRDLSDYMEATGAGPEDPEDYSQQQHFFYRCAYAAVAFLDRAYKGRFRKNLLKLLALEYNAESKLKSYHGSAAINKAFTPQEKALLPSLFANFVRNPDQIIKADPPEALDAKGIVLPSQVSGGSLFPEPLKTEKAFVRLPKAIEVLPKTAPAEIALGAILSALRDFDLEDASRWLVGKKGGRFEALRRTREQLKGLLEGFKSATAKKKKPRIFLPEMKKRKKVLVSYKILSFDPETLQLSVERKKVTKEMNLLDLPLYLFAESAFKAKLLEDPDRKDALSILLAMELAEMDPKEKRKVTKRLNRKKFVIPDWVEEEAGPGLELRNLLYSAKEQLLSSSDSDPILERLSQDLGRFQQPWAKALQKQSLPSLLERAFEHSKNRVPPLGGKVRLLPRGMVEISYDWKNRRQLRDWIPVIPEKVGFVPRFWTPGAKINAKLKISKEGGRVEIHGTGMFRHVLQFEGDWRFTFKMFLQEDMDENGQTIFQLIPTGIMLFQAQRPDTYTQFTMGGIIGFAQGKRRASRSFRKLGAKIGKALGDGAAFTVARSGDRIYFSSEGDPITDLKASRLPSSGAILWVQPTPVGPKKKNIVVALGPVKIVGKPHPKALAPFKSAFFSKWIRRFPALK